MDQHPSDSSYFMRRSSEERAASQRAEDPRARRSHIDLAERYANAARACELAADDDQLGLDPSVAGPLLQPEFRILP